MKPIADKAEVSIDFPDKTYMGAFGHESSFEARAEPDDLLIRLVRKGEHRRVVEFHLHYRLLADIIDELANSIAAQVPIGDPHRAPLAAAASALAAALEDSPQGRKDVEKKS